jgi:hypothetical protein
MGRKLSVAVMVAVVLMSGAVVQAGAASAQVAPGACELSADELAGFPVITLQHDLWCVTRALPASADGAFWLNLNGHVLNLGADVGLDGTTPVVISNGWMFINDPFVHEIDHAVLWHVTVVGEASLYGAGAPPTVVYRGPAIVDSVIGGVNVVVESSGHSIVLQRNAFLRNTVNFGSKPVTVADDATTGQPVAPLTVDIQNNVGDTGILVRADTIASGQIANNFYVDPNIAGSVLDGPGLAVQAGAINQLAVTGNVSLYATGPGLSITGAGAGGVTDGGGNRDISNQVAGAGVPNCIGIVCTP